MVVNGRRFGGRKVGIDGVVVGGGVGDPDNEKRVRKRDGGEIHVELDREHDPES